MTIVRGAMRRRVVFLAQCQTRTPREASFVSPRRARSLAGGGAAPQFAVVPVDLEVTGSDAAAAR